MTAMVPIALFGWIGVVLLLFAVLPPRRAAVVAYIAGWLFLPVAALKVPGIPAYDKNMACTLPVLLGIACFDVNRLLAFRPRWWDIPVAVLCLCPIVTSLTTGYGLYDGVSSAIPQTVLWGLPYFIGRLYFGDLESIRDLGIGVIIGGLVYVPLCLLEIRISPQLHMLVYGYHQHNFFQHVRYGGYRPMVFMKHGLMVGFWLASASIICARAWKSGAIRRLAGVPVASLLGVLMVTTVLCKSVFAIALMGVALGLIFVVRRHSWAVVCLALLVPIYTAVRVAGVIPRELIVSVAAREVDQERLHSLEARLIQEDLFSAKALQRPLFGWSGWDFFPVDEEGQRLTRGVDGLWTIMLGCYGLVGLTSFLAVSLLPVLLFVWRYPVRYWAHPQVAMAAGLAIVVLLWAYDSLLNGHPTPIYVAAAGGLTGIGMQLRPITRASRALGGRRGAFRQAVSDTASEAATGSAGSPPSYPTHGRGLSQMPTRHRSS